ncbi:MAG: YncE family protein [Saprospiraceae bacterium]
MLTLQASITLPEVKGRIDHLSYDSRHQILFVAALGNNSVEVIDLKNQKIVHSIKNLNEPQGVFYLTENNSIFISNGGTGECLVIDANTYQQTNSIKLSGDADNVRYDSVNKLIYVGYGDGGIGSIDARSLKLVSEIKLSAHPEAFQLDQSAKKIYVNVPDNKQIEIIDLEKNAVTDTWPMTEAFSNFPMCLDEINHRLFIGCRHAPKLLVIDTQTGNTISSFPVDSDVDDIFYNSKTKEIYLTCGGGYVDIFKQLDSNTYIFNGKIATHSGARTSLFIPELNSLVVASPTGINRKASILIYTSN